MTPRPTPQHPPIGLKGPDGEAASALPPQVVNILAALISRQVLRIIALLEAMIQAWREGRLPPQTQSPTRRTPTSARLRPAPPRRWSLFGFWSTPTPEWRAPYPSQDSDSAPQYATPAPASPPAQAAASTPARAPRSHRPDSPASPPAPAASRPGAPRARVHPAPSRAHFVPLPSPCAPPRRPHARPPVVQIFRRATPFPPQHAQFVSLS